MARVKRGLKFVEASIRTMMAVGSLSDEEAREFMYNDMKRWLAENGPEDLNVQHGALTWYEEEKDD